MFNSTSTATATAANGANLLIGLSRPGGLVSALPYEQALDLARNIIANGGDPAGLNSLKFAVKHDIYEMLDHGGDKSAPAQYEVRVTYFSPSATTVTRFYSDFLVGLAELQRQYHEAIGWLHGLEAGFIPENDHQANGRRDRQESEIRLCADLDSAVYRF